jgi:membrane protein
MTVGAVLLALLAGGAIAMLGFLHHLFPDTGPVAAFLWKLVTYALLGAVAAAAAATLYRYGPARDDAKWRWLTPGSIFFAVGWLLLTLGFGFYVSNFGNYGATYGSLSAIVVLLTWLYLSSYVLLFGAEFNSEIEHQTAEDTTAGEDKPLGTRGAWSADHVAAGSDQGGTNEEGGASEPAAVAAGHSGQAHPRPIRQAGEGKGKEHPYLASRASARAGKMAGGAKVSMLASVLSTLGLSMLRRKGKAGAGAALLGTAAGLAFLRRK